MARVTSLNPGYTADTYFGLVHSGLLDSDDHVELLDGIIVAMPPQDPEHASAVGRLEDALRSAIAGAAMVRVQSPRVLEPTSVPEPDVAVIAGKRSEGNAACR